LENKKPTRFKPSEIRELLKKQNFKCFLTGRELTPDNVEAEHIIPINQGGKHEVENLCLIIESLRELKRYRSPEEIISIARDIIKTFKDKKYDN
jgi:hypothetical protein